ncbi:MAG: 5-(carboxyamino)imidazole ribonucleotide synthase [Candidatus Kapabacteria bacterium]|nr:5-(carboxyamino)imidazole ribonucleotide synthase [Candidatus Kapabacteria bacterium]
MLKSIYHKDKTFTLGILGGGQLAKMLALAGYRLGLNIAIIEKEEQSPAGDMTKLDFPKGWNNEEELNNFIQVSDLVTLENEFIDPEIIEKIEEHRNVYPSSKTVRLVQDKFIQKSTFKEAGIAVPEFQLIQKFEDIIEFTSKFGFPAVIKSRKFGYDGYGNATVFNEDEAKTAIQRFSLNEQRKDVYIESFVDFTKELAVMVVRNKAGETAVYPCVETIQYRHICHSVIAPAEIDEKLRNQAKEIAVACVEAIHGIGIFGIELFLTKDKKILVNEIAPRPHNSGHYTIEACYTSQFENCIRAVCDLPLGSTNMITPAAVMINLLGTRDGIGIPASVIDVLRHSKVHLHLYNKKNSRIGRKMGHITALGSTQTEAYNRAKSAADAIEW